MRHASVSQHVAQGARRARLRIPRAEDDTVNARGEDCSRAHRAGLKGDDERAARQAPRAERASGLAQRDDLGVAGWVVMTLATVPPSPDDAATGIDDDGSNGDVTRFARAIG